MYGINKEVEFCYGHRLLKHNGKCKHLHGHSAKVVISLESKTLNEQGMVCDFADVSQFIKDWLELELDHTLLLCHDDPLLPLLQSVGERYKVLDCPPTAENIARLIFEAVAQAGFPVVEVNLYETLGSSASYIEKTALPI